MSGWHDSRHAFLVQQNKHGRTGRKKLGGRKEICPTFSDCARIVKRICPIYFYNKPILPDCEANIARLALFAQQTGGAAAPPPPPPGTPMKTSSHLPAVKPGAHRSYQVIVTVDVSTFPQCVVAFSAFSAFSATRAIGTEYPTC
jgi:hypothetical protein